MIDVRISSLTEISKEVENNTIDRANAYVRQYVSRRNVDYTFVCVEIKTKRETVAVGVLENV